MRRPPDARLAVDQRDVLEPLSEFVRGHLLAGADEQDWDELERSFEDERAFLDVSARRGVGQPRVLIEFGVLGGGERHRVGFLDAWWDGRARRLGRVEAAVLDGEPVDLGTLYGRLVAYMLLPMAFSDTAV